MADSEKKTLKQRYAESKKLRIAVKITSYLATAAVAVTGTWFALTKFGGKK
jgi:hypothetical protein